MADLPLLLFPGKDNVSRSPKGGGPISYHLPSHTKQGQRLSLKFSQLQNALHQKALELQHTTVGIEPEQVLIIETVGSVDNFIRAVEKIEGLEWLGETEVDEIVPDEDFYDPKVTDKLLGGRLYAVMSNTYAIDELLSMWNRWKADKNVKLERGLNKFKDIFSKLKDIRRWSTKDRLEETGVLEGWQEDLQHDGQRLVKFEIELWFRSSETKRTESTNQIETLISNLQGQIIDRCTIPEIAYHALLAELPADAIQHIIKNQHTSLVECEGIMFFRPVGQIGSGDIIPEELPQPKTIPDYPLPTGSPIVGLLDGLPISNHDFLANRLIIDDPDDWFSEYRASEFKHGTAMASLIIHGDLTDNNQPLDTPVYIRPIMKPDPSNFNDCRKESIPETLIAIDLLHRAIKRIFEGDGQEEAIAPTIKAINLSVCDPKRHFNHSMSPWARLLDWLSVKYNVLFIVSAGNHSSSIELDIPRDQKLSELSIEDKRRKIIKALYEDVRHRRILSPAESINCLTIGSAHTDSCIEFRLPPDSFDPFEVVLPSPFSPFGSGYRKSIKPDVIYSGGRQLYRQSIAPKNEILPILTSSYPPGNKMASPGGAGG